MDGNCDGVKDGMLVTENGANDIEGALEADGEVDGFFEGPLDGSIVG